MRKKQSLSEIFPDALARLRADEAIDALPVDAPMSTYLDTWEAAYFETTGRSPFRPKRGGT